MGHAAVDHGRGRAVPGPRRPVRRQGQPRPGALLRATAPDAMRSDGDVRQRAAADDDEVRRPAACDRGARADPDPRRCRGGAQEGHEEGPEDEQGLQRVPASASLRHRPPGTAPAARKRRGRGSCHGGRRRATRRGGRVGRDRAHATVVGADVAPVSRPGVRRDPTVHHRCGSGGRVRGRPVRQRAAGHGQDGHGAPRHRHAEQDAPVQARRDQRPQAPVARPRLLGVVERDRRLQTERVARAGAAEPAGLAAPATTAPCGARHADASDRSTSRRRR